MRKIIAVVLLLMMVTCTAFGEETGVAEVDTVTPQDQTVEEEQDPSADPEQEETIDIDQVEMTLDQTTFYKTGSAIKPVPVLKYGDEVLSEDAYTLEYTNNVNVGTATVTAVFAEGSKSVTFEIIPAKPGTATMTSAKSSNPYVVVKWRSVACTGYELQVSSNSSFSSVKTYKLAATTKKITRLKNKKTYYFRVRAYNSENGKTTYGSWSSKSCKAYTTGKVGNKYSINGLYVKDKTIKVNGSYYYYDKSGIRRGCSKTMWKKVRYASSKTKYLIAVDCSKNRTCIYKGKKGKWKLYKYCKCTTGKKSTPTIKGSYNVKGKVSHFGEYAGYTVWYATRIQYQYYFHSVLYKPYSKTSYVDSRLGKNLSHGCIRLSLKTAKWIYKNCNNGTKIIIY